MNFRKILVCLASSLAFCAGLRADDLAMNDPSLAANPYAPIVARNVFNLNPPVVDTNPVVDASLPKITPNGIVAVFGKLQVLFKVTPTGKSNKPLEDQYYTMSEGERQDEIEVMHIDGQNGIITFKNHGTVQELPLAVVTANGSGGAPSPLPENRGFNPMNGNNGGNPGPGGNRFMRFGNRGGGQGGQGGFNRRGGNNQDSNGAANGNGDDSLNLRTIPTRTYQPPASTLTPEQAAIQIEEQRAAAMDNGDQKANLFPPTPLTGKY